MNLKHKSAFVDFSTKLPKWVIVQDGGNVDFRKTVRFDVGAIETLVDGVLTYTCSSPQEPNNELNGVDRNNRRDFRRNL